MQRLWAPWRKAYIRPNQKPSGGCFLCRYVREKKDAKNFVLKRTSFNLAVLNLYPYNNGHILIAPFRHVRTLEQMTSAEKLDLLDLQSEMVHALSKAMKAQGFNIGWNLGRVAGAGLPGHVHLHIVPRWKGDVNFMPILTDTRVISESLASVFKTLQAKLK